MAKASASLGGLVPVALVTVLAANPGNCKSTKASRVRVRFGSFNRQRRWQQFWRSSFWAVRRQFIQDLVPLSTGSSTTGLAVALNKRHRRELVQRNGVGRRGRCQGAGSVSTCL